MTEKMSETEPERINSLDSIRGIAAFLVVLSHCWTLDLPIPSNFLMHLACKIFLSGRAAVMIFFVLSGFVLAVSLLKRPIAYSSYALRRFFRIYPAFLFMILLSYLMHHLIGVRHTATSAFRDEISNVDLSFSALLGHLFMMGLPKMENLDSVIWSLVHELRISFIFPLILWTLIKYRWRALPFYFLASFGCVLLILHTGGDVRGVIEPTFVQSLISTGDFIIFFVMGALLAVERKNIISAIANLTKWKQLFLFLVMACLLLKSGNMETGIKYAFFDFTQGIGAAILIALTLSVKKFDKILNHTIFVWLGRISYSLYLVHIPIIYSIIQTIGASWPLWLTSIISIFLSLSGAELITRYIENPGIVLGKNLTKRFPASVKKSSVQLG